MSTEAVQMLQAGASVQARSSRRYLTAFVLALGVLVACRASAPAPSSNNKPIYTRCKVPEEAEKNFYIQCGGPPDGVCFMTDPSTAAAIIPPYGRAARERLGPEAGSREVTGAWMADLCRDLKTPPGLPGWEKVPIEISDKPFTL